MAAVSYGRRASEAAWPMRWTCTASNAHCSWFGLRSLSAVCGHSSEPQHDGTYCSKGGFRKFAAGANAPLSAEGSGHPAKSAPLDAARPTQGGGEQTFAALWTNGSYAQKVTGKRNDAEGSLHIVEAEASG